MSHRTRTAIKGLGAIVALAATVALTGCFANPIEQLAEDVAQNGAEELVEGIAGGGGVELETGGELPANFPAEVPLIDAPITVSMGHELDGTTMWSVAVTPDDVPAAMAEAREMLLAAGFEEQMWSDASMLHGRFVSGPYSVGIVAMDDTVAYTVTTTE